MDIRQLKYFIEVYKSGSLSKAAAACYITTPGIRLSLTRLEDELGCKLFKRTDSGLSLNKHGKFLLPYAEQITSMIDECEAHFAAVRTQSEGIPVAFSIGTLEEVAGLPLSRFRKEHPDLKISIRESSDIECDAAVENGDVEFALTVGPLSSRRMDTTLIYSSFNALLVHESHPLANRSSISVKELRDVPMVIQRETTRSSANFRACCRAAGFEPVISTYTDDVLLLFYLPSIGHAASIASYDLAKRMGREHIRIIPFEDPEMAWNIYLVNARGTQLSPRAARLWSVFADYSRERCADSGG